MHSLQLAVSYNDDNFVKFFINSDCDVNSRYPPLARTLLHIAVRNNNLSIAKMLLQEGARVNEYSKDNLTALHIAICNRSTAMVELLLKYGANVNPIVKFNGKTPLYMGVEYNCPEIVQMLLKNGADMAEATINNTTILHVAFRIGAPDLVRTILDFSNGEHLNLKDNIEGKVALHFGIVHKRHDIVKMLLRKGASVETGCKLSSLILAVHQNDEKMTALLLRNGAKRSANECLRYAVEHRNVKIASLLLGSRAADPNKSMNEKGLTALHLAVINSHMEMVKVCLMHGAKVDAQTADAEPVIYYAVKNGDCQVTQLLINNGASVNCLVKENITLLNIAIKSKSVNIFKLLLEHGGVIDLLPITGEEQSFALKYLALFVSEGHRMSDENRILIGQCLQRKEMYEQCQKEIETMKGEKIVDSITFYDLLSKNDNALATYVGDEEFVRTFPSSDFQTRFTIYAENLSLNFTKGRVRNIMLQKAVDDFDKLAGQQIKDNCARRVLHYLSNEELRNFIRSVCSCKSGDHHRCLTPLFVSF